MRRTLVLSALMTFGIAVSWIYGAPQSAQQPAAVNPENFTGTVTAHPTSDVRTGRNEFAPGARTNWHSHAGGQVIFIEQGHIRTQERGQPTKEFGPGAMIHAGAGVVHWHGALPNESLRQVTLTFGMTNWMAKVTDDEYKGSGRR